MTGMSDPALPFLNESVRVPTPRFQPATFPEFIGSVYTLWNVLDSMIHSHSGVGWPLYPYGYMRKVQLFAYSELVWRNPSARTYCETGVNGGHGTAAMLTASPTLVAHSFDEARQPYSNDVLGLLSTLFRERFDLHRGDSHALLPAWSPPAKCDIILVDGDHSDRGAYQDIVDFQRHASCGAMLLLDDVKGSGKGLNDGPTAALLRAQRGGLVEILRWERYNASSPENPCLRAKRGGAPFCVGSWGWAMARYRQGRCGGGAEGAEGGGGKAARRAARGASRHGPGSPGAR